MKQNARQKRLQPSGHPDPIDQQQNGDQTKGRYQLYKEQKEGAEAGVILGKQHVGNFQQRYFAADATHFHIDKRKEVGQQQHKQRDQRVSRGTLARRVPRGG